MTVVALKEIERRQELDEIGVKTELWQPLYRLLYVLERDGALDADAAVPVGGGVQQIGFQRKDVAPRYDFPVGAGAEKTDAVFPQKTVDGDEQRARVGAGDTPLAVGNLDANGVVEIGVGEGDAPLRKKRRADFKGQAAETKAEGNLGVDAQQIRFQLVERQQSCRGGRF